MVHPRCVHVIDELSTYSYEIDKKTEEVLPILADKKNHTIDALRYAIEKERRMMSSWGVYEFTRRQAEGEEIPLPSQMQIPSADYVPLPSQLPPPNYGWSFAPKPPERLMTFKVPSGVTNVHGMSGQMYTVHGGVICVSPEDAAPLVGQDGFEQVA